MSKPSPLLPETSPADQPALAVSLESLCDTTTIKRKRTSRLGWNILLVPVALVLITLAARYISRPALFDPSSGFRRAARATNPLLIIPNGSVVPLYPEPVNPALRPNPGEVTSGCLNFLNDMLNSSSFQECRPFGFLSQYSNVFAGAKSDLPFLNDLVYGTCKPSPDAGTCRDTMGNLLASLGTNCAQELSGGETFVNDMHLGLALSNISRPAGCIPDNSTHTYCYIEALSSQNLNNRLMYQLLAGQVVPGNAQYTCNECNKDLVILYDAAPILVSDPEALATFLTVYSPVQKSIIAQCGSNFLTTGSLSVSTDIKESVSSGLSISPSPLWFALFIIFVSVMTF